MQNGRHQWILIAAAAGAVVIGIGNADTPKKKHETPRVEPSVEPRESKSDPLTGYEPDGPTILMLSTDTCIWCDRWWAQKDKWEAVGWKVEKIKDTERLATSHPTFRIYHRGEWVQSAGYMTASGARDLLGLDKPRQSEQVSPVSFEQRTLAHGSYDGTSRWTYPGDIATHLMGPSHGFQRAQLLGMSKDQLEALHSQHHEQKQEMGVQRVYSTSSSCPGGSCPTPTASRSRWRWRR